MMQKNKILKNGDNAFFGEDNNYRPDRIKRRSSVSNPHLEEMKEDVLYHFGLTTQDNLRYFSDVKFVCVGGTPERMKILAEFIYKIMDYDLSLVSKIQNISKSTRYAMFKAGPVLCVSHGIGSPSISVVLHEILKLMHHAGVEDPIFLRLGTCGGLGIPPGSIVITSESVNGLLQPHQELIVLGQKIRRPSQLDKKICKEIKEVACKYLSDCKTVIGKTMCADDFYEGQGRLDGAFCEYSQEEKLDYLHTLSENGVVNIEMESITFAAMCRNVGLRAGVVCVTMVDRLQDDQVAAPKEDQAEWQRRLLKLAALYIRHKLVGDV